jgi:hypothetical protein
MGYKKHSDYISDAVLHARDMALVVTSGDGTLSVHDIRTCKFRYAMLSVLSVRPRLGVSQL